jgi:hypothetical protein
MIFVVCLSLLPGYYKINFCSKHLVCKLILKQDCSLFRHQGANFVGFLDLKTDQYASKTVL